MGKQTPLQLPSTELVAFHELNTFKTFHLTFALFIHNVLSVVASSFHENPISRAARETLDASSATFNCQNVIPVRRSGDDTHAVHLSQADVCIRAWRSACASIKIKTPSDNIPTVNMTVLCMHTRFRNCTLKRIFIKFSECRRFIVPKSQHDAFRGKYSKKSRERSEKRQKIDSGG